MRIAFDIPLEDLADTFMELGHSDTIDFICQLDLSVADAGFTEALIKRLVTSIRSDLSAEDFADLIAHITGGQ
jgi:hypothetical protein